MYLDFYQLHSAPFPSTPDPTWFFGSASHTAALDALAAGIATRQGFVVITGVPGVGKTTVVHTYLARVAPPQLTTVVLWQARLAFRELLALLARRFDVPVQMDALGAMLTQLQQRFRHEAHQGCPVALLIDEAQDLPLETLRQLPLLVPLTSSQEPLLQIGLVGQPALLQHLRRRRLRRVTQRIGRHATIRPLTEAESLVYIRQRVAKVALPGGPIFTQEALQTIVRHAHGVPHDLNLLCTNVLLAGCGAHQQPITADLVQQVRAVTRGAQRFPLERLGLATAAGLGLVAGLLWVASFSPGPRATRHNAAAPAPLQARRRGPRAPPGSGCRPCHSLSLRHRRRLPPARRSDTLQARTPSTTGHRRRWSARAWRRRPPPSSRWRPPSHLLPRPCPHVPLHPRPPPRRGKPSKRATS